MKNYSELIEKGKKCISVQELLTLAKENDIDLTEEQAEKYFAYLNPSVGELSDDEISNVSGGGCYSEDGYLQTTIGYGCEHYEAHPEGLGIEGTCCRCKYWDMNSASQLIIFGQTAPCRHPENRKK